MYHIRIGCCLQEAATKYQGEGFSRIYIVCVGTNTQCLIDLLETMFRDIEEPELADLETAATQALQTQAAAAKKFNVEMTEGLIPADKVNRVTVISLPIPMEFGLEPKMMPETDPVKKSSKKDPKNQITHFYYTC